MAHGEVATRSGATPGVRAPATSTRRPPVGPQGDADSPLSAPELELLDDVLIEAERITGLRFAAFLGDLGPDTRSNAESLVQTFGAESSMTVLLAISPGQRVVEVVTGGEAARRISDRAARLAVLSVISACAEGDIGGALVNGLRILADQAGALPQRSSW